MVDLDRWIIENPDQHTDECLAYAESTGKPYCIVDCADQRIPPGTSGRPPTLNKAAEDHSGDQHP